MLSTARLITHHFNQLLVKNADTLWAYLTMSVMPCLTISCSSCIPGQAQWSSQNKASMCQWKLDRDINKQRLLLSCLLEECMYRDIPCRTQRPYSRGNWHGQRVPRSRSIGESVHCCMGPKFGELEGHTLVIFKALCVDYGLVDWDGWRRICDACKTWDFPLPFLIHAFRCVMSTITTNTSPSTPSTIVDHLMIASKDPGVGISEQSLRCISSNSRILIPSRSYIWDVTSSMTKKVSYA